MIASERRRKIIEELNERGILSIKEASKKLGMSEITVRRDFEKLEKEGKLKRVQGGASIEENEDGAELTMRKKIMLNLKEKEEIAEKAACLVTLGDCVFIDGGTTMLPLAALLGKMPITIVTYNTLLLDKFSNAKAEIIVVGGKYIPSYNMNVGHIAQDMLKQFAFDIAFLGCSGVSLAERAVYTAEMESMAMKRIAMENAQNSHLLIDMSKLSKRGYFKLADFTDFRSIICNGSEIEEDNK